MTRLSIRWRLTLWYSIALGVILCSFCLVLLLLMRQQVFARTDAGLREEVEEIGLEIGLAESAEAFESQAKARFSQHDFYDFLVIDEAGHPVHRPMLPVACLGVTLLHPVPPCSKPPSGFGSRCYDGGMVGGRFR